MLVLTRRAGESVMIDGHIEIKVLRIRGNQVHLGIDAPADTMVHRHEVWLRLQEDAGDLAASPASAPPPGERDPDAQSPSHNEGQDLAAAASESGSRY